ncbi:MAG: M3 family metallopeptidase [Betaproteobacteria bacterium]
MNAPTDPKLLTNPLLAEWTSPHGLPPFTEVKAEYFAPAFTVALKAHRDELDAIAANSSPATFENTLAEFDKSGRLFSRIDQLFYNLAASETSPALQAVEREMAAPMAAHTNAIYMHAGLFSRLDSLYSQRTALGLTPEQLRLLERVHLDFVRAGAKLSAESQARYGKIMEQLAELTTQFSQNVLADEAATHLLLKDESDLAGLPESVRANAKQAAVERGLDGYVITISRSLIVPFLTFSDNRALRERAYKAWTGRGEGKNEGTAKFNNAPIIAKIMALRLEQAKLHGYSSYTDYALMDTMAGKHAAVFDLLMKVWVPAKEKAALECEALQAMALSRDEKIDIAPWDWRYYAEKVRQARYDLDDGLVKPYFSLDRMVEAAFDCAQRLFGLRFVYQSDLKAYHPDVKIYEVQNVDGSLLGVFLHDNFSRATKRGGAWMSSYRQQSRIDGDILPIIVNNNNFAKGAEGKPTLLSFDDARTLFHEFGHGLHGLLSSVNYERLSGTSVLRDFVELPSQLFEHWLSEPEVLKRHARHVETGEPIPDELMARLKAARKFNQGFDTVEYTSSALVDLALHSQTAIADLDIAQFEKQELAKIGMPPQILMRHRLPHFGHLFSGSSYASQYYVYLWAEVLDADGFEAFVEAGNPFDNATAQRLRKFIYSSGNTMEPTEAYRAFRGRAPTVTPMLKKKGLLAEA